MLSADQQEVGGRRQGRDAGQLGQLTLQPGTLAAGPALHPAAPAPVGRRISQQPLPHGGSQAIHRPGIPPGSPPGQALGVAKGITKAQARYAIKLGEAADHHQVWVRRQQRDQALGLATRHQRQESLIGDHQGKALQQGLQGGASPKRSGGVVGIGEPKHLARRRRRKRLRHRTDQQRQRLSPPSPIPAGQGPRIVGKARLGQHTYPYRRRIPARPGEQLRCAVTRQQPLGLQAMQPGQAAAQTCIGAVGIGP